MDSSSPRRGLVIGCGGILGFAWTAVVLDELERALGWDAREAKVLVGTSAGAEMVAMLGSGRATSQVLAALDGDSAADPVLARHVAYDVGLRPPRPGLSWPALGVTRAAVLSRRGAYTALAGLLPRGRADARWLRELGAALANPDGWVDHPATWLIGLDAESGQRVAFGTPGAPKAALGDAIAASWAIPGWFRPAEIAGRRYLDGGTASPTSADLVAPIDLDEVIIIAPMSSRGGQPGRGLARIERLLRVQMTAVVDREQALLEGAGIRVIRVEPGSPELDAMGFNFNDIRRRTATLESARTQSRRRVEDALKLSNQGAQPR